MGARSRAKNAVEQEEFPEGIRPRNPITEAFGVEPHKLYRLTDVAELLSVDEKLVRWWIRKGSIEAFKLPNRAWRIRGIEIVRMLEQGRSKTKGT